MSRYCKERETEKCEINVYYYDLSGLNIASKKPLPALFVWSALWVSSSTSWQQKHVVCREVDNIVDEDCGIRTIEMALLLPLLQNKVQICSEYSIWHQTTSLTFLRFCKELHCVPGESILCQKYAFIKKSTIFTQSLRNFVKMRY